MHRLFRVVLAFSLLSTVAHAQEPQVSPPGNSTPTAYSAPSPQLLPTNPLYKFQLAWDKISLLFSFQPLQKAARYIKLADRELTIAAKLIDTGETALATRSAFRGEHYMTLLVSEMKSAAYATGSIDQHLAAKAHSAALYHQQLLGAMIDKTTGETQNTFKTILEFSQRNDNELRYLELEYSSPATAQ